MNHDSRPSSYLEWALEHKRKLREELSDYLEAARRDHHSRRKPIACGMTIHPAIGCSFGCLYCYVPDMGFTSPPRPYPLNPAEMVAALALNPYFLPGPRGTLVAFGSVTEPFMNPQVTQRTLGYLYEIGARMSNPQQLSTKAAPGPDVASNLAEVPGGPPNVLISVSSYAYASKLEPRAASVEDRLEWGAVLIRMGVPTTLFLRPIIPGVSLDDLRRLLQRAWELGFRSVVLGSLRVTPGIIKRLEAAGVSPKLITSRLPRMPRNSRDQVVLRMTDLKTEVAGIAEEIGFKVLPASCSANVVGHGLSCWACRFGPCGPTDSLPPLEVTDLKNSVEILGGLLAGEPIIRGRLVSVKVRGLRGKRLEIAEVLLTTVYKREFRLTP